MFRKLLSTVTSMGVMAGLVTVGAVATAGPAAAATFNIFPYEDSQDNPTLPRSAGWISGWYSTRPDPSGATSAT